MKKFYLFVSIFLISSFASAQDLNYDYVAGRRMLLSFGAGVNILNTDPHFAIKCELGVFVKPRHLLSLELGGGSFKDKKIGTFTYTMSNGDKKTDGIINYNYTNLLAFLSYSYYVKMGNSFEWRIGPSIGMIMMSGGFSFDPSGLKGEPSKQITNKYAFAGGLNTGFTINFPKSKRCFFDLGWKIYGHSGLGFPKRNLKLQEFNIPIDKRDFSYFGNQVMLSFGFRFAKAKMKH